MVTTMQIYDTKRKQEKLTGNFLLDLGAGGFFYLNKNLPEVINFVSQSDRMLLDTTRYRPNPKTELSVIMPKQIQINNIKIEESFIAAMKMVATENANKYVGMIGDLFFANFIIIFDFEESKFYMKPASKNVKIIK